MFWECQNMHAFMSKFIDFILLKFGCVLTKTLFFLGNNDVLVSQILLLCKQVIYQCKLKNEPLLMDKFLYRLKLIKNIEFEVAKRNNNVLKYMEKWEVFIDM